MNWNARSNYGNNNYGGNQGGGGQGQSFEQYPNRGSLFANTNKRSENSADYNGYITMTGEVLDYVMREAERGGEVKLELSGWRRMSRNNNAFTSLSVAIPYAVRQEQQGNPTYRPRQNAPQNTQYSQRRDPPPQRQSVRQGYAQQSRGGMSDAEFKAGDSMPDFRRGNPNDPPF